MTDAEEDVVLRDAVSGQLIMSLASLPPKGLIAVIRLIKQSRNPLLLARQNAYPIAFALCMHALCAPAHTQQRAFARPNFRPLAFRIGPNLSPDVGLSVGLDYTVPNAGTGRGFATRFTFESGFVTRGSGFLPERTMGNLTLDQVYQRPGSSRSPYVGAGLGIYIGPYGARKNGSGFFDTATSYNTVTTLGSKIFVGTDFTSTTSMEAALHVAGNAAFGSLQIRLKL